MLKTTKKATKNILTKQDKTDNKILTADELDAQQNSGVAALSYLWILFIIPLLGKRNSKFAQFHAKQGLVLFGIELIASMFAWFPIFGQLIILALIVVAVMGVVKALNEEWWKIPYINEWSKKINF